MKLDALTTLDKLQSGAGIRDKREKRLRDLLRPADAADDDWFMHVPGVFNNALDIRLTEVVGERHPVWTQGGNFGFATGDTIYDTPLGYGPWDEALQHIRTCFHVSLATSVSPPSGGSSRRPGVVTFSVMMPNESKTALDTIRTCNATQDQFVHLLIAGFSDDSAKGVSATG